jgi:hypothetical protein
MVTVLIAALASCRKKDGINQNLNPDNQKPYDFMSTKEGSFWKYGSRDGVPYTRYARNKDTIKNSLKYSYYEQRQDTTSGFTPEYFGKNGVLYITLIDLDGSRENYMEYVFWKQDAKQGDAWTNTGSVYYPGLGTVGLFTSSNEAEEGIDMKIDTTTYHNVVHVHSDIKGGAFNFKVGTLDFWFVKNLGIIREEAHINVLNAYSLDHTDSLISYHIEP